MEALGFKGKLMLNCDASPDRPLLRMCEEESSTYGGTLRLMRPCGVTPCCDLPRVRSWRLSLAEFVENAFKCICCRAGISSLPTAVRRAWLFYGC